MVGLIKDVCDAPSDAKEEASRELLLTVVVALSAFFVGPLLFSVLIVKDGSEGFFSTLRGSDIYIAAVSLLSMAIYSISKEYNTAKRNSFGFPHAATIMALTVLILFASATIHTARVISDALPKDFSWRGGVAAFLGWTVFVLTSLLSYAVLVLRHGLDKGTSLQQHREEEDFVGEFNAREA